MLRAQASGTQVKAFGLTINNNGSRMDVRHPTTIGSAFGMAYVMAELRCLTAQVTLQYFFSFDLPEKPV